MTTLPNGHCGCVGCCKANGCLICGDFGPGGCKCLCPPGAGFPADPDCGGGGGGDGPLVAEPLF